jgi:hypothetical protein
LIRGGNDEVGAIPSTHHADILPGAGGHADGNLELVVAPDHRRLDGEVQVAARDFHFRCLQFPGRDFGMGNWCGKHASEQSEETGQYFHGSGSRRFMLSRKSV